MALVTPGVSFAAGEATNIGNVSASSTSNSVLTPPDPTDTQSAPYQAPTKTPLTAMQPTAVVSKQYLDNNVAPTANYDTAIRISPSVTNAQPNGPGLSEGKGLTIRGFQDGQFNVTFDGIPFADATNFAHNSAAWFMTNNLGQISVDRGPGTASTIGDATFGGTIAMISKAPDAQFQVTPYTTVGSFDTFSEGLQVDTGRVKALDGGSGFINVQHVDSDGAQSFASEKRTNFFGKWVQPIGDNTLVTLAAMYNNIRLHTPLGETKAQIQAYGPSFAWSNDQTKQNYWGFNYDNLNNDFEYIGIDSDLGSGWSVHNKAYTYGYYRDSLNGSDPQSTKNGTFYSPNDVPGQTSSSYYRAWGDTLSVQKDTSFGALRAGLWVERQSNDRNTFNVDLTLANAPNPPNNPSKQVSQLYNTTMTTIQPFFETEWNVTDRLKIIGGIKESIFIRSIDAQVNKGTKRPLSFSQTYTSPLPSLMARYAISPVWSAYAQVARGFLAPQSSYFNVVDPSQSSIAPETTWNYQIGTTWQSQRLSASIDGYYIDFGNYIGSRNVGPNNTVFFNQGGVNYLGVEAETTYYLGKGLSLYANGSLNSAKDKQTGQWVANAPKATAAGGFIYNKNKLYASLLDKWVGSSYGDVHQTPGINPYNSLDAGLSYTFPVKPLGLKNVKLTVDLNNILNSRSITYLAGYTSSGDGLFYTQAGRSVFASLQVPLF